MDSNDEVLDKKKELGLQGYQDEEEEYDLAAADKKQKEVAYLTRLLAKDLEYT